ncbi:MAG TPA: asparaginase [Anaerolineae bacterium]|nr:asparaginase [Anaerolineae bacterium]HQH39448.1 asparaginase [Anaerolineae bacterium]
MMRKRVYIVYTGGTIGMQPTADGYAPAPGYLAVQLAAMPELRDAAMPAYDIHEYDPLLDSANMTPDDWLKIAQDIAAHYDAYDGFIVLHGTDTMAYTASALPFMLQGLGKPVILTGSQLPLCEVRNDARENLITVMLIAANYAIPEVCLYFGNKLLRGCRAVKVNAVDFEAFDSPNYPPLGTVGIHIDINWAHILPPPAGVPLIVQALQAGQVGTLRLFPGIATDIITYSLRAPVKGLILETYGIGNGPTDNRAFMAALEDAVARGVVIVDCTQCLKGTVDLESYTTGSALAKVGVLSGFDMTVEAALAKLFYLFGQEKDVAVIRQQMQMNLRGELTR